MAVLTASDLAKDVAGRPLFAGVSLRLERRQRLTIAGRNGAGKTTLLRVLAGEESADRGELSLARDARVALHDQRPPRERDLRLRDYVLGGCAEQVRLERELEGGRGRFVAGRWHAWRQERAARELAQGRAAERQSAELERLERFVARFRAGTRARQAQSRLRRIERVRPVRPEPTDERTLAFDFRAPERSGRVVFELEGATIQAGDRTLLQDAELWLERGEHVALVGPNGAGKTTLLETLAGRREPAGGRLRRGHNVQVGLLSQHADELPPGGTVVEAARRATGLTENKARGLLGGFLFSGEDAD